MSASTAADGGDARIIDRWAGGAGWIADPADPVRRTSHALAVDGDVWLVDPVDFEGLDALVDEFGSVAGVVVLLDRHKRDAAAVATRYDVPVTLPATLWPAAGSFDAPTDRLSGTLGDTGYRPIPVVDNRFWREAALLDDAGTLVVPEAVGTAAFFRASDERLGVHPGLRLLPPRRALGGLAPERVLVGHGEGVFDDAAGALADALARSRRNAPRLYLQTVRQLVGG